MPSGVPQPGNWRTIGGFGNLHEPVKAVRDGGALRCWHSPNRSLVDFPIEFTSPLRLNRYRLLNRHGQRHQQALAFTSSIDSQSPRSAVTLPLA